MAMRPLQSLRAYFAKRKRRSTYVSPATERLTQLMTRLVAYIDGHPTSLTYEEAERDYFEFTRLYYSNCYSVANANLTLALGLLAIRDTNMHALLEPCIGPMWALGVDTSEGVLNFIDWDIESSRLPDSRADQYSHAAVAYYEANHERIRCAAEAIVAMLKLQND